MNRGRRGNAGRGYQSHRGRSPSSGYDSFYGPRHAEDDAHSAAGSSSNNARVFRDKSSQQMSSRNFSKQYQSKQTFNSDCHKWRPVNSGKNASPNLHQEHKSEDEMSQTSEQSSESMASNSVGNKECLPSPARDVSKNLHCCFASVQIGESMIERESEGDLLPNNHHNRLAAANQQDVIRLPLETSTKDQFSAIKLMESNVSERKDLEDPKNSVNLYSFDICPPKAGAGGVVLKPSLLAKNREKRNDMKRMMEGNNGIVLRPGMVLLKCGISPRDQVKIVKKCRELGRGSGGFYQPGYRDGGKLHLKMMCLGKNWDPETSTYGELRPVDQAKPPNMPVEFYQLVEKAMKDSYAVIGKDSAKNLELILPPMKPNICIVNFYSQNGRLGLHQDRDESAESLAKGLPVVSFSIGDSAEFLFGDQRDSEKAEKVILESGDVLIFGGKSRHIFHGVTAIQPNTAPKSLLEETDLLCPGRLNLTFRQY